MHSSNMLRKGCEQQFVFSTSTADGANIRPNKNTEERKKQSP